MARKFLTYGALLIGGYLVVTHYTGAARTLNAAGSGSVNLIKAFQGR